MAKRRARARSKSSQPPRAGSSASDQHLLDSFSELALNAWQALGDDVIEFELRRYHALETLRQLHKSALIDALTDIPTSSLTLDGWCRIVDYRYSNNPLSAAGSLKRGGRFNIGNDCDHTSAKPFPALYIAENHRTAMLERFGESRNPAEISSQELALRTDASYSHVQLKGQINHVLELQRPKDLWGFTDVIRSFRLPTDVEELGKKLGYTAPLIVERASILYRTLRAPDWRYLPANHGLPANPQIFSALVRDAGFEAIRYKSTKGSKTCLAIFPDMLDRSDSWLGLADAAPEEVAITELNQETWTQLI